MNRPTVMVIDNYDSFTHNLAHAFATAGADVTVHRNDAIDRQGVVDAAPDLIVLSPGPGHPAKRRDFGVSRDLITDPTPTPIFGVCLGMQGMAHHTGGTVVLAPAIVHGETARIRREDHPIFHGLPSDLDVGRYHSLAVDADTLPATWNAIAMADDGTLMAMAHRDRPWIGVQFHPESILTPDGPRMVQNVLRFAMEEDSA